MDSNANSLEHSPEAFFEGAGTSSAPELATNPENSAASPAETEAGATPTQAVEGEPTIEAENSVSVDQPEEPKTEAPATSEPEPEPQDLKNDGVIEKTVNGITMRVYWDPVGQGYVFRLPEMDEEIPMSEDIDEALNALSVAEQGATQTDEEGLLALMNQHINGTESGASED